MIGDRVEGPRNPPAGASSSRIGQGARQRTRVLAALSASWVSAGLLVAGSGGPLMTAAGLLLALLFPGWLLAEMIVGRWGAPPELWLMITLGFSLVVTLALGAVGAASGELSRSTLGWCWLAVCSFLGGASLLAADAVSAQNTQR